MVYRGTCRKAENVQVVYCLGVENIHPPNCMLSSEYRRTEREYLFIHISLIVYRGGIVMDSICIES